MATTSNGLFGFATQTSQGSSFEPWGTLENILIDDTSETACAPLGDGVNTEDIRLTAPVSGSEVPVDELITHITITIRAKEDADVGSLRGILIQNGDSQGNISLTGTFADQVITGDLATWGLTQQQARDFADGTTRFEFRGFSTFTVGNILRIQWAKCQFTYEPAPSELVNAPTLF